MAEQSTSGRRMAKGPTEHKEQVRLAMHLRTFYPQLVVAASGNGAAVSGKQRLRLMAEGLLPGFPDVQICAAHGGYFGMLVEMKKADGRVSLEQTKVQQALKAAGYYVLTCYGFDEALAAVLEYVSRSKTRGTWTMTDEDKALWLGFSEFQAVVAPMAVQTGPGGSKGPVLAKRTGGPIKRPQRS